MGELGPGWPRPELGPSPEIFRVLLSGHKYCSEIGAPRGLSETLLAELISDGDVARFDSTKFRGDSHLLNVGFSAKKYGIPVRRVGSP